ncbi:GspH/FimT family pseudopilin [Rhizobacter sp. SG703]|uniref:GspH/FimT family pseudopilin n=1 Tax=Rhizobacter sp. SG703 TaxID=2587140 RepID=UPI0014453C6A|nr:GspH/FimT family pseudopilin [Rhizobacter sp. SG703]NKI96896.1 type IV fimbrial biogenesis protein FimT [Rhizobacter sp. SG703]
MFQHARPQTAGGFTLIELMACVAVCAVLALAAVPSLRRWMEARRLDGAAHELAADLRLARSEAINRNQSVRIGFRGATPASTTPSNCYVVYVGAIDACRCTPQGPADCDGDGQALRSVALQPQDRLSLQANVATISFDAQHGTSTPAATLRLAGASGLAIQHVVNVLGRVRSCSPLGTMSGYRAC